MAITYSNIATEESSTITSRVATVTINRGGTNEKQEILVIGDGQTSNAQAVVLAQPPTSTEYGLGVRIIGGPSSVADLAVRAVLPSTASDNPVIATIGTNLQSTAVANSNSSALNVRVVGHGSSAVDFPVRAVLSSTNTDNPVRAILSSTSADNPVRALLSSTSADNPVVATIGTNLQSSAAANSNSSALNVRVVGGVSSAVDFPVRVSGPASTTWASSAGFHFDSSGALQVTGGGGAGSTDVSVTQLRDSSGGSISAGDSANQAIRVNVVAGAAGGSTIVTVSSLPMVSSAAQGSNSSALNVRMVGGVSSAVDFPVRAVLSSTNTDNPVVATIGTNLQSTAVANSNSSALNVRVVGHGSSAVDFPVRAVLSSTNTDNPVIATIGTNLQSTSAPAVGSSALMVREVHPTRQSTRILVNIGTAGGSTSLVSSVASKAIRVYAYSVTSTITGFSSCAFCSSGTGSEKWGFLLGSGSSGITGVNLAVPTPGSIFETASGEALLFSASSTGLYSVGISYFTE